MKPRNPRVDIIYTVDDAQRYTDARIYRPVPIPMSPAQMLRRHITDIVPSAVHRQFTHAMEQSLDERCAVSIRYALEIRGVVVFSRATVTTNPTDRSSTLEVIRYL